MLAGRQLLQQHAIPNKTLLEIVTLKASGCPLPRTKRFGGTGQSTSNARAQVLQNLLAPRLACRQAKPAREARAVWTQLTPSRPPFQALLQDSSRQLKLPLGPACPWVSPPLRLALNHPHPSLNQDRPLRLPHPQSGPLGWVHPQ